MKLGEITVRLEELYHLLPEWIDLNQGESMRRTNINPLVGLKKSDAEYSSDARF
jgi:hypothetical protein